MSQEREADGQGQEQLTVSTGDLVVVSAPMGTLFSSSQFNGTIGMVTDAHDLSLKAGLSGRWLSVLLEGGTKTLLPAKWLTRL